VGYKLGVKDEKNDDNFVSSAKIKDRFEVILLTIATVVRFRDHRVAMTMPIAAAVTAATSATRSAPLPIRRRQNTVIRTSAVTDIPSIAYALPVAVPIKRTMTAITPSKSSLRECVDMWLPFPRSVANAQDCK